ncbi:MAG: AAA family ATPase [bacterium]
MHLKSLEISGFKSFAKKATLSFTSPISAIVGPNGSGKSNVAEAFRFVLGEQSIKSLRGKRGEDLIFNGGSGPAGAGGMGGIGSVGGFVTGIGAASTSGRANRAGVKVVFDNSKRILNVDFDEVTLERVVHRDSSNEYFINGSLVRLKDIVELLAGAHIGASGHHIISQGEADRILNANIRERREMIEDALGLKIYQYKKTESQRKLEKTEENMKSVESLRREIAPHLKFLKKQVEKVEKVQEMRESLKLAYQEYFKREEVYLKHEHARVEADKKGPTSELRELDAALAEAKNILASSKNADATSGEVISLEQELARARNEKDATARELGQVEGEISAALRAIQREKDKQSRDENKTVYLRDVEEIAKQVFTIDSLDEIRKLVKEFIARHRTAENSSALDDFEKEVVELRTKKAALEHSLKIAGEKEVATHELYTQLRHKIDQEKDTNREAEKNVFKIIARQNEIRGILNTLKSHEDRVALEQEAYKRELQEAHIMVGREAVNFASVPALITLTDADIIAEARTAQEERRRAIEKTKIRIEDSGAGNSSEILKEYKEVEERDGFLARELEDLDKSKVSLVALIAELDQRLDIEFKEGILKINVQFQNFFALMFGGGNAGLNVVREKKRKCRADTDLVLSDEEMARDMDAASGDGLGDGGEEEEGAEGIEINVNLPRKKVKSLMMLSGGERALTSIALLFAVSQVNPPPFIILDETDAALDEANSKKYGDMIANLSQYSQLILITHNRETMSRAGVLYGVTMGNDGASRLLSIQFDEAVKVAK